jgi:hypothetical protein
MRFLREKLFFHALELFFNPLNLLLCRAPLLPIQLRCGSPGEPPVSAVHNRSDHLQIADEFGPGTRWCFLLGLPLRFEKQRGIVQNALADRGRSSAPSRIQLPGFADVAVMLGENRGHALAVLQALTACRHQELHRHLRRNLAGTHLLLDRFWQ